MLHLVSRTKAFHIGQFVLAASWLVLVAAHVLSMPGGQPLIFGFYDQLHADSAPAVDHDVSLALALVAATVLYRFFKNTSAISRSNDISVALGLGGLVASIVGSTAEIPLVLLAYAPLFIQRYIPAKALVALAASVLFAFCLLQLYLCITSASASFYGSGGLIRYAGVFYSPSNIAPVFVVAVVAGLASIDASHRLG